MSRRSDSKIDLDKYQPSLEDALRAADEEAAQARLRKALDNPALDAALAEYRGEPAPAEPSTPPSDPPVPEGNPGPRTKQAPAAPPVTSWIGTMGRGVRPSEWSATSKVIAAIALAFLPAMIVYVLFVRPQPLDAGQPASSASATAAPVASTPASASAGAAVAPAPAAVTSPTALPSVTAIPSVAPSTAPSSPAPRPRSKLPAPPRRRSSGGDPYDAPAPPAPKTAEPAPPPPPSSSPPPPTKPVIIN